MPRGEKVYVLKNREEGRFGDIRVFPDYQNPLLIVQWMVLETGGSPLALRGTKNCGDKSRSAGYQCCFDPQPWHNEDRAVNDGRATTTGKNVG